MKNGMFRLALFVIFLASVTVSTTVFAEDCTWQNKYRSGGYQAFRDHSANPRMERLSSEDKNPRVNNLQGKRSNKTIGSSETIELNILESGGSPRQALLAVKKHEGNISQKETVELNALESTRSPRVAILAVKKFEGKLKNDEKVELEALEKSGGDVLYANLAVKKSKGEKLTECEAQELIYIDRSVATPGVVVPVPGEAVR